MITVNFVFLVFAMIATIAGFFVMVVSDVGFRPLTRIFGLVVFLFFGWQSISVDRNVPQDVRDHMVSEERLMLRTRDLVTIGDGSGIVGRFSGSFLRASGSISDELTYDFYFFDEEIGAKRRDRIYDRDNVYIFEGIEGETPRIEDHMVYGTCSFNLEDLLLWIKYWCTTRYVANSETYDVYVPENTIVQDMVLDNE